MANRELTLDQFGRAIGYSGEGVRRYARRGHTPRAPFGEALIAYLELQGDRAEQFSKFVCGEPSNVEQDVPDWLANLAQPGLAARARTNLPAPLTRLFGRADEIERYARILGADDVRLLTLTGSGGVGKTRLSLAIAERLRDKCRDGVYFAHLAPATHARSIDRAIADSLRLKDASDRSTLQNLIDYLGARRVLLVLDNLAQLAEPLDPESRRRRARRDRSFAAKRTTSEDSRDQSRQIARTRRTHPRRQG